MPFVAVVDAFPLSCVETGWRLLPDPAQEIVSCPAVPSELEPLLG